MIPFDFEVSPFGPHQRRDVAVLCSSPKVGSPNRPVLACSAPIGGPQAERRIDLFLDCSLWNRQPGSEFYRIGNANPTVRTRKQRGCIMQRRRSTAHTFEDRIAAQKVRLEAQVARLGNGLKKDDLLEKIRQLVPGIRAE